MEEKRERGGGLVPPGCFKTLGGVCTLTYETLKIDGAFHSLRWLNRKNKKEREK